MDAREHIKFLFDLVTRGELRLKPLSHGLDNLCLELIQNNYSRYRRLYDNLREELIAKGEICQNDKELEKYRKGYYAALVEARNTIDFWDNLSRLYYEGNPDATITPRTLPESRKCIIIGSSNGESGKANRTNSKTSKANKLAGPNRDRGKDNRLLASRKKRRKESRKRD